MSKPEILSVTHECNEGRWTGTRIAILPYEEPSDLGRCNYDIDSPNRSRNATDTDRGLADEVIVVVKLDADEDMVTYLRIKLPESGLEKKNKLKAKDGTRKRL